jgi:hypothetical protein
MLLPKRVKYRRQHRPKTKVVVACKPYSPNVTKLPPLERPVVFGRC